MLTEKDVRELIAKSVVNFDVDSLGVNTDFAEAGIDSLDHLAILLVLQEEHNLKVPDSDIDQCASIGGIMDYAAKRGA